MVREGYKKTELGEIPEDWDCIPLSIISFFQEGPGLREWQWTTEGMKVVNVTNLVNGTLDLSKTNRYISFKEFKEVYAHFAIEDEDILMASSGNSYCKVSVVSSCHLPLMMNTSVIRFHIKNPDYDSQKFLKYLLDNPNFKITIDSLITGSAQPNFGPYHLKQVKLVRPPLPEQHRIATVLSTIDSCIEKTEALIAKLKSVKAGLMQDLLTRGIDDEGRIRTESTHEFKDTEIGRVPVEWEVNSLDYIADSFKNGIYKEDKYYGSGYPSVRMYNISDGLINLNNTPLLSVTETELREYGLVENDILINRVNSAELVGKVGIVPKGLGPITFESKNIRIRVRTDISVPSFVNTYLSFEKGGKQVKNGIKPAISQSTINQEDLGKVLMPNPSLDEQKQICQIIASLQDRIFHEEKYRKKLLSQKIGLMSDLLTGNIRISEGSSL